MKEENVEKRIEDLEDRIEKFEENPDDQVDKKIDNLNEKIDQLQYHETEPGNLCDKEALEELKSEIKNDPDDWIKNEKKRMEGRKTRLKKILDDIKEGDDDG